MDAVYAYLRNHDGHPLVVLPTGAGKSIVLAQIVQDAVIRWRGRVLLVTHVRELIEQTADKIRRLCPGLPVGIHSAGLGRRDTSESVVCCGIQSVYQKAAELGHFDLALVDEAHLISDRDDSMYGRFFADLFAESPACRVAGVTATPFRTDSGLICGPGRLFQDVCYEVGVKELIAQGYLSPLLSKAGIAKADTGRLHVRGGEFVAAEVEELMDDDAIVESACSEIVELTRDRRSVLIFASGVRHGRHVQNVLQERRGVECGFVSGETPTSERDQLLTRFRGGPSHGLFDPAPLKYLCNCQVLCVGFDAPAVDTVAILRATNSPGLLIQIVGRGFRLHPGKENCLILDYGGNILRHGPVDQIRVVERSRGGSSGAPPAKECPQCRALIATAYSVCPDCGHEFPQPQTKKHDGYAAAAGVLSGEVIDQEWEVRDVLYSVHTKKDADETAPKTLRVDYRLGLDHWASEWVCFEHAGWARRKAEQWWTQCSPDPVPDTAAEAVHRAECGALADTEFVTVRSVVGEKFDRIIGYKLGPLPEPSPFYAEADLSEVPF